MSETPAFKPQRHEFSCTDVPENPVPVFDHLGALHSLETDLHVEASTRRVMAASLFAWGWQTTPKTSEHLAWLLNRETDALAAYSLYRATIVTHPTRWELVDWQRELLQVTPFPILRTAILDDLFTEGCLDGGDEKDADFLATLYRNNLELRPQLTEYLWESDDKAKPKIESVLAMLKPDANMAEKVAAMRIVQFCSDTEMGDQARPKLAALFRVERHQGLSMLIGDILVRKNHYEFDLDLIAFLIKAYHGDAIPAAHSALSTLFFSAEDFLLDRCFMGEQRGSVLTDAVLACFSPSNLPLHARHVVDALTNISTTKDNLTAVCAAIAVLQRKHLPCADGHQLVFETAAHGQIPEHRALAIRVLCEQKKALLPLFKDLKALTYGVETDPKVRRAAFLALTNTNQSGLPISTTEVIDLYFRYLREAPFEYFADAITGSEVKLEPQHYLTQFSASFDAIKSKDAREAAFGHVENPFGFGIDPAFKSYWDQIVQLMLRALDNAKHGQLHNRIFWNMLNDVKVPKRAAATFAIGLRERLGRVKFTKRSRGLIEGWLKDHE